MSQISEVRPDVNPADAAEQAGILHSTVQIGTIAQIVVAVIAVIGLLYLLKLVLVTILVSMLIAYVLEPPVSWLDLLRIPRSLGALIVVTLTVVLAIGALYFSYNSATAFVSQVPQYSATLRQTLARLSSRANKLETQARSIVEAPNTGRQPLTVRIEQPEGLTHAISENGGTILDILLAIGFVPFLVYFMLVSKDHFHVATVRFFPREHRLIAHRTVGSISVMIREYVVANAVLGASNALILTVVFWFLGIPYFYFIGPISGFVSMIPYLGLFLAILPPLAGGLGVLHQTGIVSVLVAVIGLHVITMNVFYPKVIGERLQLNALAVSVSLLFWAWLWGAWGLVLAIPMLGALKVISDHIDPLWKLGEWLGDSSDEH